MIKWLNCRRLNLNPRGWSAWNEWRNVVKKIREIFGSWRWSRLAVSSRWLKPALVVAAGLVACAADAQPANDNFANATVISGRSGSTTGDNTSATLELCETNAVVCDDDGPQYITNSVWLVWTAPANGTVEFDTIGSSFDTVLAVWTTPTDICDPGMTNLIADDSTGANQFRDTEDTSYLQLQVVSNTTYYVEVASWDDGTFTGAGGYGPCVLNWNYTSIPSVITGPLTFTKAVYNVSQWDSQSPVVYDNSTENSSLLGGRVTVTRPAPGYGRIMVDYEVVNGTYSNYFATNFWGTNILATIQSTDTPPIITYSNYYSTNIVAFGACGYYNEGYRFIYTTNAWTNSATLVMLGVYSNSVVASAPLTPAPAILPIIASLATNWNSPAKGFQVTASEYVFGYLQNGRPQGGEMPASGETYTNGSVVYGGLATVYTNTWVTNYYGTNLFYTYQSTSYNGPFYSTNYFYTNIVAGQAYVSNTIYTNGSYSIVVTAAGTNWDVADATTVTGESILNASNYISSVSGLVQITPAPTNIPPPGSYTISMGIGFDASSNTVTTVTNFYSYIMTGSSTVASANGISLISGTVTFSNLQTSADIMIPLFQDNGPDAPAAVGISGLATVTLSNPRLDPLEASNTLFAPAIAEATAKVNARSVQGSLVGRTGVFNFERGSFRTARNVGTAYVSVKRVGGNSAEGVSVDYILDPDWTSAGSASPNNNFDAEEMLNFYDPANTFPLQAGSDYATENSDFTVVTGTLNWGAYDSTPKTIAVPILNNGLVEPNLDLLIQLHNALPNPVDPDPGMVLGQVNEATLTILFDDKVVAGGQAPGQQPAGAVDRSWNQDHYAYSTPNPYMEAPGTTPGDDGTVYAVAVQPDGNAIIAGSFVSYDNAPYNRILRVTASGYPDTTFQGNSSTTGNNSGANNYIAAVALQPDGNILIGGNFTAFNGYNRHYVARLNTDGSVDPAFNPGLGANGQVWAMALQTNGQIIIGGEFTSYNGTNVNGVARLNTDGSLDTAFNPGAGPDGIVDALVLDASGRVLIGGNFDSVAGAASGGIARLNTDGSLDTTFTPGIGTFNSGTYTTDPVHAIAVQADGQILAGGAFSQFDLMTYNGLVRLNPDGTLDLNFQPGTGTLNPTTQLADTVYAIQIQPQDNMIVLGGNFTAYNQTRRLGCARIFPDGSLDTSFMDAAYNQFAGLYNQYFNENVVLGSYPYYNSRCAVFTIGLETSAVTYSNIIVGGNFEMVGGGSTRATVLPRSNVARVIGGQTPGPGNLQLQNSAYSVENSAESLYVSLVRTNGLLGTADANFSVTTAAAGAGVATAGTDFSPSTATPLWVTTYSMDPNYIWTVAPGEWDANYEETPVHSPRSTSADVMVGVFNPGNISGNLSAKFNLSSPGTSFTGWGGEYEPLGVALGAQMTAPFTIIDANVASGVVGFSAPNYTVVAKSKGQATITLTRTNGSTGAVTVYFATTDGTATNGVDYTGTTNILNFSSGQTNLTFTIPVKNSFTSIQPDKTVNLRLFTPGGGATLGLTNATLTLINPNITYGQLSFSATNYSVNENAGNAVVVVNRLGGSSGTLGVTLMTVNGTAYSGTNYIGITTNLTWNNNDATSRTILIPVLRDGVATPNLVAYLQLTNSMVNGANAPGPLQFGSATTPTNATLTVVNVDSAGTFQFSAASYSVKKYAGYALIPVMRIGGSVGTAAVNFATFDDSATNGINYTGVTNTLVFTNGQVSQTVSVPILSTGGTNGLKDLIVQLNTNGLVTLAALGSPTNSKVYIIDSDSVNEPPGSVDPTYDPFVGFNGNIYALAQQTNNQLVVVGDFTMASGVTRYRIARLNADGSMDSGFSLPSSTYGADAVVRAVAVQADGRILLGGFFTNVNSVARGKVARLNTDGTLDSLFNPGSGADNPVYAIAQPYVNGNPMVLMGGAFASVSGTPFNGVARLDQYGTPDSTFNASGAGANATVYALAVQTDGKIVIGGDFTSYNNAANFNHIARLNVDGSVDTNFLVSASGASGSVRAIAMQLDGKILIGGLFTNVNGVALNRIARLNADGTIDPSFKPGVGADGSVLSIALQTDTRIVLGGDFATCNGVTRSRVTRLNPDGTVDPSINFGTGANGFVAAIAIEEATVEGYPANVPDEKIIIGGAFTQYNSTTNDYLARIFGGSMSGSGAFEFSSATYQVDELGTNALITVVRTGGTTNAPTGDIMVNAFTADGTAKAGVNYTPVSTNLDFPLGEVSRSFMVPIKTDGVITPNLTVNLALMNPTAPAVIGNQPTAVLTIINEDSTLSLSASSYMVAKNIAGSKAAIDIYRIGGTNSTVTVTFIATNGSATPVTDYTPVNETVTFAPGVTDVVEHVSIVDNGLAEGNQTVGLQLTNVIGSVLTAPTNAVLTIIDTSTSPGFLYFTATNFSAYASDGYGYLSVARTNGTYGLVSVTYTTGTGTAQAGVNYTATTGTLTFNDGESNKTFAIPLLNSAGVQDTVYVPVILSNPTGGAALIDPTNAVLAIANTNPAIAFKAATNNVSEDARSVNIVVERINNTNVVSSVNYATTNGTAVAGLDYSNTVGTLTFGLGEIFKSITIPLINQSNILDKVFGVNLSNPVGARLMDPSSTVVVIQGDAAAISFSTNSATVEKNGGSLTVTVVCSNPRVEPVLSSNTTPLEVSYMTVNGTAKAGVNYNAVSGTLLFTNGVGTNTFVVPIVDTTTVTGDLGFSVVLTNVTAPGYITPYGTESVVIKESNAGLCFSQTAYYAFKTAGYAAINVYRTGYTDSIVSVDYLATNGTAIAGLNFYSTNGTLVFTNGQTVQTFNVALIAGTTVQPNLTALLQLSNPTNGVLVKPILATLTIVENGGSYVIPAGSMVVTNYTTHANDGIINSNDTVQVLFGLRDGAGLNVTNLVAVLMATNGVASPSPSSQTYGQLTVYGHSVSKPFTFTARGTNSYTISPTFQLYDSSNVNSNYIGMAAFTYTLGTWTTTFANTNMNIIYDGAAASLYPSMINVSGIGNTLVKATVTLTNLSHQSIGDVDVLVVSPTTNTLLMGHVGGNGIIEKHVTLTFDDAATNSLPSNTQFSTSTNKPTRYGGIPNFP